METVSGIKAYVREDIGQEESERQTYSRPTEKWRRTLFEELWKGADDSKLLGSHHEVRYAEDIYDLIHTLEEEDPAPVGFSFYWPYAFGWYNTRTVNRAYRARYPVLKDTSLSLSEITEAVEREKTILLGDSEAASLFGATIFEEVGKDFEHVQPISDTCVIKPKEARAGLYRIVYAPRQVKMLRTRHINEARKEKERQAAKEKELAERKAAQRREQDRQIRWEERQPYLSSIAYVLEKYIEWKLSGSILNVASDCMSTDEVRLTNHILTALDTCDKIVGASAAECLNTHSLVYKRLRRLNRTLSGIGIQISRVMKDPDRYLFAYADPMSNRDEFPRSSGMSEGDSERNKKCADLYKCFYRRLKRVAVKVQKQKQKKKIGD